jgi:rhodopsin family 7TM receptor
LSIFQPTVYSRRTSIFISFLSIVSLLSSVAAVQQQVVNQQQQQQRVLSSSSIIATNETTTTILKPIQRRMQPTTPLLSSTIDNELINKTNISQDPYPQSDRSLAHIVIIVIICSIMCCVTVIGNLVVILTVCLVRKLQTASNILIVSLGVSDILVGLFIMPLAMGKFINNIL